MWGFPVYVLDPTLQQGHKLPKCQPRSRRRIFVGFSPNHSIDVLMILNPDNSHISSKFHVIFDDSFSIILSNSPEEEPAYFWNEFYLYGFLYSSPLNDNTQASLDA